MITKTPILTLLVLFAISFSMTSCKIEKSDYKSNNVKKISISEISLSDIDEAELLMDVFEVNGGAFSNKTVFLNGCFIGLLPSNEEPYRSWQTKSIKLPIDAIQSINTTNTIGISDKTDDAYNIKNFKLKIRLKSSIVFCSVDNTNVFCSVHEWWPLKQGKAIKLDGSAFTHVFLQ